MIPWTGLHTKLLQAASLSSLTTFTVLRCVEASNSATFCIAACKEILSGLPGLPGSLDYGQHAEDSTQRAAALRCYVTGVQLHLYDVAIHYHDYSKYSYVLLYMYHIQRSSTLSSTGTQPLYLH